MAHTTQLLAQLKSLKLSGAADTLEHRLREGEQNQLSYCEFLAMLLTDEIDTRRNRRLQRLIAGANILAQKTLEAFDFSFNRSINPVQIRELTTCRFIENAENVFFLGPTGTGKTHLAQALAHAACRKHLTALFFSFNDFFKMLHTADINNTLDKLMKKLMKTDLLIIDDFAFKKISQSQAEYFYALVDARYNTKSAILTSNRAIADWSAIFPDPIIANAIMDRLAHNAHQIVIKGESYRKHFSPSKNNMSASGAKT